jgi:hypothetical protein
VDDIHVDTDGAQLIEAALHLLEQGIGMRQRQHQLGTDAVGIAIRELGIGVVQHFDARLTGR